MEEKIVQVGDYINVQAYKHNGVLYRQWNGLKIIEETDDHIILFLKKVKVTQRSAKKWVFNDPALWFFSKKELFNCVTTLKDDGNYNYINIASRFIFEDSTIKYIDYDLDIKVYPRDSFKIVDRKEFTDNRKKFKYPDKLVKALYLQLETIVKYYYHEDYIFNNEYMETVIEKLKEDKLIKSKFRNFTMKNSK